MISFLIQNTWIYTLRSFSLKIEISLFEQKIKYSRVGFRKIKMVDTSRNYSYGYYYLKHVAFRPSSNSPTKKGSRRQNEFS